MNEFEKYINKVESDYVKANPKQSDWGKFSNRLSLKINSLKFLSGVFLAGVFTISYFIINSDESTTKIIEKDNVIEVVFNDSIIIKDEEDSGKVISKLVVDENSLYENKKTVAINSNSIENSKIDSSNSELEYKMNLKSIDVKLESEISASNLILNLNKIKFCQNDTLKASYSITGIEFFEDSILSIQWLLNNDLYEKESLELPLNDFKDDIEGSLIVETSTSMIKKDFSIYIYKTHDYEITLVENTDLKKSVEIRVEGLQNLSCEVNDVELLEDNKGFNYEFSKPGEIIFSVKGDDLNGCNVILFKNEIIQQTFNIYAPTAFTPNDDGLNSVFMPSGIGNIGLPFELTIYNEKGIEVFKTLNVENTWNGKDIKGIVKQGVYIWKLIIDNNGVNEFYNGKVVLIK